MRARRAATASATAAAVVVGVTGCAGQVEPEEATPEDYCLAVHGVDDITAQTTDDGVLVGWFGTGGVENDITYRVHRRAVGADDWGLLGEVDGDDDAEMTYLDTDPADGPGAYEYTVTRVDAFCGGESDLCAGGVCEPAPTATPTPRL